VPYLPFVEVLESLVDRATVAERLPALLGEQGPELSRVFPKLKRLVPGLPAPLELPPEQARRQLFNSFCDFIARIARDKPILLIIEDLHWADAATISLVLHLANRISDLPLAIIATYRDADADVTAPLAGLLENLVRGRDALRITLKGLALNQVGEMLKALSDKEPPLTVVKEIYAETEGNPFFIEELLSHLKEENRLYDSTGTFRSQLKIGETDAPRTVRMVVRRRLARLSEPTRNMMSTAATVGRTFTFEVLRIACAGDMDSLLESVAEAEQAGLLLSTTNSSGATFEFSHELIRQAVLGGLSAALRERLHLQVAAAIEQVYRDSLGDHVIELAHHYARGGNPAKAAQFSLRACTQCTRRASFVEAVAHFETGLEMLRRLPDDPMRAELELDLRIAAHPAFCLIRGSGTLEVEQSAARAMELCQRPGINWQKSWEALSALLRTYMPRDSRKAREVAAELVTQAELHGSARKLVDALYSLAFANLLAGDFESAAAGFDRAIASYQSLSNYKASVEVILMHAMNQAASAWNLWFLGYPDRALQRMNNAFAGESSLRGVLLMLHHFALLFHHLRRDIELERKSGEESLALANELQDPFRRGFAEIFLGWGDAMAGDLRSGIARMRHNLAEFRAIGAETDTEYFLALIAMALGKNCEFEEGLRAINEAFLVIDRTDEQFYAAEIHRLKGELLLMQNPSNASQADQCFRTAIETSRRQKARSWELRATMSLARLLAKQGKRDEAHAMLIDIYRWFTEGFETADLKDAKALLVELRT